MIAMSKTARIVTTKRRSSVWRERQFSQYPRGYVLNFAYGRCSCLPGDGITQWKPKMIHPASPHRVCSKDGSRWLVVGLLCARNLFLLIFRLLPTGIGVVFFHCSGDDVSLRSKILLVHDSILANHERLHTR